MAVEASKAVADLGLDLKTVIKTPGSKLTMVIEAGGISETLTGRGSPLLSLMNNTSLVVRKSSFACDRTLMILSDKAAGDLSRELVRELQKAGQKVLVTLIAEL